MGKYRNLAVNTVLFALNSVATKLITFLLVPLYTAYLSAGEYGLTDMSLTVISLLTPLATLDVAEAVVRFIVGDRARGDSYAVVALGVTVASVAVVVAATPMLDLGVFGGLGEFKGWFVAAYTTSALMNMCGQVARGMGRVKIIPVCAGVSSAVALILAVALIAEARMGVAGYFASVTMGPAAAIAIYLTAGGLGSSVVRGARSLVESTRKGVWDLCRPMLRYALPLIPNSLFWWLGSGINRLFITGMMGIAESGLFAAASKVPNLLNTVYAIFQQAWQLSAFQESSNEGLSRFFSTVFALIQAGMTVLCAVLSLVAPWLAAVLLQGETYGAWPMITPLLLSNLFNVFATFYGTVYATTMHTTFIMGTTVFGAVSCIVLTPVLIPVMGTYGACVASAVGQALVFLMRAIDSKKYLRFDVGWRYLVPTIALLVLQAAAAVVQLGPWVGVSFVCLVGVSLVQGVRVKSIVQGVGGLSAILGRRRCG